MTTHWHKKRLAWGGVAALLLLPNMVLGAVGQSPAQTVLVVGSEGGQYESIQAAIDAAPPGATIRIEPGRYEECLSIRKSVVLEGAGWEMSTIAAPPLPSIDTLMAEVQQVQREIEAAASKEEKRKLQHAFMREHSRPALWIEGAQDVRIRGLKFTASDPREDTRSFTPALVIVSQAQVQISECAVIGSPKSGIQISDGSDLAIRRSLVAAVWWTGIVVGERDEAVPSRATIAECDIRNCYYAGILVRQGNLAAIRENWVSGAAWHGIRYDDCSPTIGGNRIFGNARCGIYASGKTAATVSQNLFLENHMCGICCWFENADTIAENTFAGNREVALSAVGSSRPQVHRNIFFDNPNAVTCAFNSQNRVPGAVADPDLSKNLFWRNAMNLAGRRPQESDPVGAWDEIELPEVSDSLLLEPGFVDTAAKDFSLAVDSTARREGVGAADPLTASSPWPLQPEEEAIIPDGPTRDSRAWKHPEPKASPPRSPQIAADRSVSYEQALVDLFEVLGRQYPCFALKGIDWPAVGRELLPRVKEIETDDEFGFLCMELVARLEDSHATLTAGAASLPTPSLRRYDPGLACLMGDDDKPIIYYVDRDGPAEKAGVRPGMTVLTVQGEPVEDAMRQRMDELCRYSGYSSERYLRYHAAQFLSRQTERGEVVSLKLQDGAGEIHEFGLPATLDVRYLPRLPVPIPGIQDSGSVSWKMLDGGIGYIYVRRIRGDLIEKLDRAVAELKDAQGLIVDVRGNSGGGFDSARAHRNFSRDDSEEPDRPRFDGPMAVLIDPRCISAGEGWASWFVANERAKFFGEATAGASARKRTYDLKNGLYRVTFPVKAYSGYLDRPIERRGLEPDVPVRQNAGDLAKGRDTVLEAAKRDLEATAR